MIKGCTVPFFALDEELRQMALSRAMRELEPAALARVALRAAAYLRAGCAAPISAAEDEDALRREILRRSLFPARLGAAA